ncbi:MAG: hypothetical protein ACRDG3_11210 [Tepidiformaceae bacterium]
MLRRLRWRTESMFVLFLTVVAVIIGIALLNTIGANGIAAKATNVLVVAGIIFCAATSMEHRNRRR